MTIFRALLHDENGFIISTELVVVATLLVVGLITGVQVLQTSVVGEMNDVAAAIGSLDQSYFYAGKRGCSAWGCGRAAWTGGSVFVDCVDETRTVADFGYGYGNYGRPTYSATYTPAPFIDNCVPTCPPACTTAPSICPTTPQVSGCLTCDPVTSISAPLLCAPQCSSCSLCPNNSSFPQGCDVGVTSCLSSTCNPCDTNPCRLIW